MAEFIANAKMLIRRPRLGAFNAFAQPEAITRFWLKSTTGPLRAGAKVEWEFMVPGAKEKVSVTAFEGPSRIAFTWSDGLIVLCDLKTLLESGRSANLVKDKAELIHRSMAAA